MGFYERVFFEVSSVAVGECLAKGYWFYFGGF